ncbi:MAG: glycogen debranching N-terminal domain-containing protein [Devosia sp.]|nr:glycogen debranching N-terminal domain-containing protein [Devosia sp.]
MLPLKNDFCYAILDAEGMVRPGSAAAAGIYLHDTRHLSRYAWSFGDLQLIHQHVGGHLVSQYWSRMAQHTQALLIRRTLALRPMGITETLVLENCTDAPVGVSLWLELDADFADIFEARGYHRQGPANPVIAEMTPAGRLFTYRAEDGVVSSTRVLFADRPLGTPLTLAPRETRTYDVRIDFETTLAAAMFAPASKVPWSPAITRAVLRDKETRVLDQAVADIESLLLATEQGPVIAAGIPNFVAPFGRDSLTTVWLLLDTDPGLARSALAYLAAHQGTKIDPYRDEEPGKILHERRESELSRTGELPFGAYYGSADSTPLFLVVLGDYVARTNDVAFARELEPNWRAALGWIERCSDPRGFIHFGQRGDVKGLSVQSWKDSSDSMSYSDGRLGEGSLAVSEVQGYVFAALRAAADLSSICGGPIGEERDLRHRAAMLAERFDALYWMPEHNNYALALDEQGRQLDVNASDSGHLLWSGIVPDSKQAVLIDRLLAADLWSGYGLRTLSTKEKRYNPLSYHNGSVWPHDTAIFAAGLRRYGNSAAFSRVREALVALANLSTDLRLPELVGGYARNGDIPPLPYVESCRPQAWAAAALIYVLTAQ